MNNSQGSNQQVYCPRSATHCWACLISPWLERWMGIQVGMLPRCIVVHWSLGCLMEQRANVRNATGCLMMWSLHQRQEMKKTEDKHVASYCSFFVLTTCIFLRVKYQLLFVTLQKCNTRYWEKGLRLGRIHPSLHLRLVMTS